MKNKSKNNHNTALKNPAVILGIIGIVMILLIIIFNIRNKMNSSKNQSKTTSDITSVNIDKNSEYVKVIDKYFQALNEKDAVKLVSLFPKNKNYTKENTEAQIRQMYANYEATCGSNVKISYEFSKAVEVKGETLESLKKQLANTYGIETGISTIYSVEIYLIRTGDISTQKDTIYLNLAKINDKWYIV